MINEKGQFIKIHGMCGSKFYSIWHNMKDRCLRPAHSRFKNWGGRGILPCEQWLEFINFKNDMYESYLLHIEEVGKGNTTLDRKDNDLGYSFSNCRWVTWKEQQNNSRNNKCFKAISPIGEEFTSKSQKEFAKIYNLDPSNITKCLKGKYSQHKGWKFSYI